jgi:hypothetical protein
MKRGDIFHDGLLGYWIIHEKPKGKKLFCVPLDIILSENQTSSCNCFHELGGWDLGKCEVVCNLYEDPKKAKSLLGKGNLIKDGLMAMYNSKPKD